MTTIQIGDRVRLDDHVHPKVAGRTGIVIKVAEIPGVIPLVTVDIDDGGYTLADADQLEVLP